MTQRTAVQNHADIVTLRDLVNAQIERLESLLAAAKELEASRHDAIDAKLAASHDVMETRLEHLNALRSDVITKTEYVAQHESLSKEFHAAVDIFQSQIAALKEWKAEQGGKASTAAVAGAYVLALVGWIVGPIIAIALERLYRG